MDQEVLSDFVRRLRCLMLELLQRIEEMEVICQFVEKEDSDD